MELYRHGYTLMDRRLMELVEFSSDKSAQTASEQAAPSVMLA